MADFVLGVDLDGVCADHATAFRRVVASDRGVEESTLPNQQSWDFVEWGLDRGEFERLLDQATPGYVAYAEAESYQHVEPDQVDLVYKGFRFNGEPGDRAFEVVQARKDYLVAQVEITVLVRAEGTFTFSIWDSIDKEYVSLGASQAHTDAELEAFVLISFERDGDGPWEIVDVELLQDWDTIDFGYIEPDYSREWEA